MKVQKPAKGISIVHEAKDGDCFLIDCECTSSDHAVMAWVEVEHDDDDDGLVTLSLYATLDLPFWSKSRWRMIWDLLVRGHAPLSSSLLMKEQAAINTIHAIDASLEKARKHARKSSAI